MRPTRPQVDQSSQGDFDAREDGLELQHAVLEGGLKVRPALATGLAEGTPVVCGTSDTAAETFGAGMVREGMGVVKLATAATVNVLSPIARPDLSLINYYPVVPDHWYVIAATNSCASAHKWLRDTFFRREGEDAPLEISVTRARIEIPVVESKMLAGNIGYVKLQEFSRPAPERLKTALKELLDQEPAGLILDLRGNPGGLLDVAVEVGSQFVAAGDILIERKKDGSEEHFSVRTGGLAIGVPLAVLVNEGSASASEIVAGAIQDAGRGPLVGTKTFGKGSVQLPQTLSDGSMLRVTIAHWFTPKGRGIHGTGLEPDIPIELSEQDRSAGRDPQLDRAVEYLRAQ